MEHSYIVTKDVLKDSKYPLPEKMEGKLEKLFEDSKKGEKGTNEKLIALIDEHPNFPTFRNYLSVWYLATGDKDMERKTIDELYELFPEYSFAIMTKARILIEQNRLDDALNILGKDLCIKYIDPKREIFHITEHEAFVNVAMLYLLAAGEMNEADDYLKKAKGTINDSLFSHLEKKTFVHNIEKGILRLGNLQKNTSKNKVKRLPTLPQINDILKPSGEHYKYLFGELWDIDPDRLKKQIDENPSLLIEELKKNIQGSITHFEYCEKNDVWSPAPIHALFILQYIADSKTANDILFDYLRQPEKVLEFWLVDWHEDIISASFTNTRAAYIDDVEKFLKTPSVSSFQKMLMFELLAKKLNYFPEKREAIIALIKEIFSYFEQHHANKDLFDENVLAAAVGCAIEIEAKELLPQIKYLYDKGWIDGDMEGDYEEAKERMDSGDHSRDEVEDITMFEEIATLRKNLVKNRHEDKKPDSPISDEKLFSIFDKLMKLQKEKAKELKSKPSLINSIPANTPRNVPCPCSSGKKYKHCHGKS